MISKSDVEALFVRAQITPEEAKRIRVASGLSQAELAAVLSCGAKRIQDWENGRRYKDGLLSAPDSILLRELEVRGITAMIKRITGLCGAPE
jgi:DNA-binding transcriptional regulator YiaG